MTTENMVRYKVNQINDIISILDSISSDTKTYTGLSLILAISDINKILHDGEIYENTISTDSCSNAANNDPDGQDGSHSVPDIQQADIRRELLNG